MSLFYFYIPLHCILQRSVILYCFVAFYSILFHPVLLCSIQSCSVTLCFITLFRSTQFDSVAFVLFHSTSLYNVLFHYFIRHFILFCCTAFGSILFNCTVSVLLYSIVQCQFYSGVQHSILFYCVIALCSTHYAASSASLNHINKPTDKTVLCVRLSKYDKIDRGANEQYETAAFAYCSRTVSPSWIFNTWALAPF